MTPLVLRIVIALHAAACQLRPLKAILKARGQSRLCIIDVDSRHIWLWLLTFMTGQRCGLLNLDTGIHSGSVVVGMWDGFNDTPVKSSILARERNRLKVLVVPWIVLQHIDEQLEVCFPQLPAHHGLSLSALYLLASCLAPFKMRDI